MQPKETTKYSSEHKNNLILWAGDVQKIVFNPQKKHDGTERERRDLDKKGWQVRLKREGLRRGKQRWIFEREVKRRKTNKKDFEGLLLQEKPWTKKENHWKSVFWFCVQNKAGHPTNKKHKTFEITGKGLLGRQITAPPKEKTIKTRERPKPRPKPKKEGLGRKWSTELRFLLNVVHDTVEEKQQDPNEKESNKKKEMKKSEERDKDNNTKKMDGLSSPMNVNARKYHH